MANGSNGAARKPSPADSGSKPSVKGMIDDARRATDEVRRLRLAKAERERRNVVDRLVNAIAT